MHVITGGAVLTCGVVWFADCKETPIFQACTRNVKGENTGGKATDWVANFIQHMDPVLCPMAALGMHLHQLLQKPLTTDMELFPAGKLKNAAVCSQLE